MFYYGSTERLTQFLSDVLEKHYNFHKALVEETRVFQRLFPKHFSSSPSLFQKALSQLTRVFKMFFMVLETDGEDFYIIK